MKNGDVVDRIKNIMYEEMGIEPRIKVFAFGGAGGKMGAFIAKQRITGVKVIAVDVDARVESRNVDKKVRLGKEVLGTHKDTAGEPRVAEYVVSRSEKLILDEVDMADAVVLIGALGGGMGTGGVVEAMRLLKRKSRKPMMAMLILPFSVEKERRARAMEALRTIESENLGTYFLFDSDELLRNRNMNINAAYTSMYLRGAKLVENLANATGRILREKFDMIYMRNIHTVVEEKMEEMLGVDTEIYV